MSLSRENMADLTQELVDMYTNMETELMELVAEYLAKNNSLLQTFDARDKLGNVIDGSVTVVQWRTRALRELGALDADGIKMLAKYSGKTVSEVKRIYKEALNVGLIKDEAIMKLGVEGGILQPATPLAQSAVVEMMKAAQSTTLTTFNSMNNSILRSLGEQYTAIINGIETQIMSGTVTIDQAVAKSVRAFAERGLTAFTAANGAEWTPEAYARMLIQSDVKNAVHAAQEQRYKEYGNNHIEVSAHAGARPKCAVDQGYIYSLDGDTTPIEDLDGNRIEVRVWSSTSYGEPDGILGINCGHSRWAFVPGISKMADNEDISKKENSEKYKERQQQRYIERNIRNAKREKLLLQKSGAAKTDIDAAGAKVKEWQSRARKFVSKTNGTRYYEREQIYVNSGLKNSGSSSTIKSTVNKDGLPKKTKLPDQTLPVTLGVNNNAIPLNGVVPKEATLKNVTVFAGDGVKSDIRDRYFLSEKYGGDPDAWQKLSGIVEGEYYSYDIHWYQNGDIAPNNRYKLKRVVK